VFRAGCEVAARAVKPGRPAPAHWISPATFYKLKARYGRLQVSEARRLRMLEAEHARLKSLLADAMLDNAILKGKAHFA